MGRRKNNPELVEELVNTLYDHVYTNSKEDDEIAEKYWSLSSGDMKRLEKSLATDMRKNGVSQTSLI